MDKSAQWLALVAKKHNQWINIVKSFGEKSYYEDIVQQMYITLYKYSSEEKIIKNGVVSNGYVFFTLRSIYYQYYNSKRKIKKINIDNQEFFNQIPDDSKMDEQIAFDKICRLIDDEIENWEWYNKKLFKIYRDSDLSIRGIAQETSISWVSIFNTLKNSKNKIKDKFQEDWDDYENNDYELI
tara:strand:+ start:322 stop:870 length:549 start_codon:yes stop_codon:yes gene_type:complete